MGLDVIITMVTIQRNTEEDTETELTTQGYYQTDGEKTVVSYEDSEATGFIGSVTKIIVEKENSLISIVRTGNSNTNLTLEKGKKHHCFYSTQFGEMSVGIYANKIVTNLDENGGKIHLQYTVDINSAYMSDNEIVLDIKPIKL